MPVRKLKKNYRSVTGLVSSKKNSRMIGAESTLERDLFTCLEFDPVVTSFEEQPISINFQNNSGRNTHYTPDILIEFNLSSFDLRRSIFCELETIRIRNNSISHNFVGLESSPVSKRYIPDKPILAEVKYRKELFENWSSLKPKFKVAREFVRSKGWKFCIFTENEIRGNLLNNIKFLTKYTNYICKKDEEEAFISQMNKLVTTTPKSILDSLCSNKLEQAELLPILWHLIAINKIKTNLHKEISMSSELSL